MRVVPQSLARPDLYSCPEAVLKPVPLPQVIRGTDSGDTGIEWNLNTFEVGAVLVSTWPVRWLPKGRAASVASRESVGGVETGSV